MDAAQRLLQFIDFKGFGEGKKGKSIRVFYSKVGLSNGTIKEGRSIGSEILNKIFAEYPDINMDWVITGRGEMEFKEPQMLVGSDEGAKIAIGALKDQVTELQAKLINCLESKEKLVTGYIPSMNEPPMRKEKAE